MLKLALSGVQSRIHSLAPAELGAFVCCTVSRFAFQSRLYRTPFLKF